MATAPDGSTANDLPEVLKNRALDLVLVLDVSQSMRPCLEGLLANLEFLVEEVARAQGTSSRGEAVDVDWRIGVVAHHGSRGGRLTLRVLDITAEPTDPGRVRAALQTCAELAGRNEASLHALDWAIDRISWRFPEGGYRRALAGFTDEPIAGGDLAGVDRGSFRRFLDKLYGFSLFLVAPFDRPPRQGDDPELHWSQLRPLSFLKGFHSVRGGRPADWQEIDFSELTRRVGRTATQAVAAEAAGPPDPNVFGLSFPPARVEVL